ncbi:MAG: hypothetical protein V4449_00700 [Patescibacteria group bacterium]
MISLRTNLKTHRSFTAVLFLLALIVIPVSALAISQAPVKQGSFGGTVLQILPCTNISGSLIMVSPSGFQFVHRTNVPKLPFLGKMPTLGQEVGGVLLPSFVECTVVEAGESKTFLKQPALYYSAKRSSNTATPPSQGSSSGSGSSFSSSNLSSLFNTLKNPLSSLFSNGAGSLLSNGMANVGAHSVLTSSASGVAATNAVAGGSGITLIPFGGIVLSPPVPCTTPPGAYMVVLGPPSPGSYMYVPVVTKSYLYGPPVIPGQWVLGQAVPGVCVVGTVPTPVMLIMTHGTSLLPI